MKIVFSQNIFENPIESSQLERHVYVWKFSNIVGTDSPSSGCYWWFDAQLSGLYNSVQRDWGRSANESRKWAVNSA